MVNDNTFAVLSQSRVKLYSRPQLKYTPPPVETASVVLASIPMTSTAAKKKWLSKVEKEQIAAAAAAMAEETAKEA